MKVLRLGTPRPPLAATTPLLRSPRVLQSFLKGIFGAPLFLDFLDLDRRHHHSEWNRKSSQLGTDRERRTQPHLAT